MPKVVVGVPVYNGGEQLRECLECLISQTLRDIEIRIYDNASEDNTGDIAREFAERDSRVKYIRHSYNIRAMPNFLTVLRDCETEFVMWRAHDDLCSPNYIEVLYNALALNPGINVAVPTICTISRDGKRRVRIPKSFARKSTIGSVLQLMFNSYPAWFYGLWRRDALLADFQECWGAYPYPWALDHLILFPSLLKRSVIVVKEAIFIQRLIAKKYTPKKGAKPPAMEMQRHRMLFSAQCRRYIERLPFTFVEKAVIRIALPFYVDRRVYRFRSVIAGMLLRRPSSSGYSKEF